MLAPLLAAVRMALVQQRIPDLDAKGVHYLIGASLRCNRSGRVDINDRLTPNPPIEA